MTDYRVRLYGEVILGVTREYHAQRMEHLASQTEAARFIILKGESSQIFVHFFT
jgi:hypothetical protein